MIVASQRNLKVLIVDDDPASLELLSEYLVSRDIDSTAMVDSGLAIAAVHIEKFDGIILDLLMPGIDGFELISQVRKSFLNRNSPIIVVSGIEDGPTKRK